LNLTRNMHGISLANTNDTTIYGNQISSNQYGITLYYSHNATIIGNQITNNTGYAIDQYDSNSNIISNNLIEFNKDAIYAGDTLNTVISSNQIISNQGAAIIGGFNNCTITKNYVFENIKAISVGNNCLITENNITKNSDIGITFRNHNVIMANYICENSGGLSTMEGTNNTIVSNAIVQNAGWGISFTGRFIYTNMRVPQNNLIYHNNFIGNNNGGTQIFISDITFLENGTMKKSEGLANFWDNGVEGNYWSDYHPTTQENENSTLGNTPYYINENNQDNYPLLAPLEFAALELPALEPPQETEQTATDPATLPALVIACIALVTTASIGLLFYFKKRKT
jgi:parallel beta-helix repeat protein